MIHDQEIELLIEQAARNLSSLELLVAGMKPRPAAMDELQQRIQRLKSAYVDETNAITRAVLSRAIERRRGPDRRKPLTPQPVGTIGWDEG